MKFISTWKFLPGAAPVAAKQFLQTGGAPPDGITILGRWHKSDLSGGFVLLETDDITAGYESAVQWAETLEMNTTPVLGDDQVGPVLAKYFGS